MLLAVDVGNTNIVFAIFNGDELCGKWRISTDTRRTEDEYAILLSGMMEMQGLTFSDVKDVIVSSVVPQNMRALERFCSQYFQATPMVVGDKGVKLGIKVLTDTPGEVGADRLVNAVAAYQAYRAACIVIDFGTATTFDVVNEDGDYIGGLIAPGINLSMDALHAAAAKLPEVSVERPHKVIGKSTVSAMQAGIYYGYVGLIEGIVERIRKEMKQMEMPTVATGGLVPLFSGDTPAITHVDEELTIKGLHLIYKMNKA